MRTRVIHISAALILAAGLISGADAPVDQSRSLSMLERNATEAPERARASAKADSQKRQRDFNARLFDFANAWNRLVKTSDKGGWNAKEAKKTREAFERLVRSEGWIE